MHSDSITYACIRGPADWVGISTARLLAAAGHRVTLAVRGYAAGEGLQQYVRDRQLAALARERVAVLPLVRPYSADDDSAYLQHVLTEEPVVLDGVAGLVLACGQEPAGELLAELQALGVPPSASGTASRRAA